MGEVFLADRLDDVTSEGDPSPQVALKRILPHLVMERDFVDRFVDEARLMIRLRHPNLLPVYELRRDHWGLYMVMEYLKGYDLRTLNRMMRAQDQSWPTLLAVWIIREISEGLSYAHQQKDERGVSLGLVHRDVSPSNILISEAGDVKLIDFGVARAQGGIHQSISGALQGKLVYMSPEQAQGDEAGPQSDIFSLGLTLYEMLSGTRPREGISDADTLRLAQSNQNLRLEEDWPEGDQTLIEIINQAIIHSVSDRIQSAQEFAVKLTTWLDHQESSTPPDEMLRTWLDHLNLSSLLDEVSSDAFVGSLDLNRALELQLITAQSESGISSAKSSPLKHQLYTRDEENQVTLSLTPQSLSHASHSQEDDVHPSHTLDELDSHLSTSTSGVLISQTTEEFGDLLQSLGDLDFSEVETPHQSKFPEDLNSQDINALSTTPDHPAERSDREDDAQLDVTQGLSPSRSRLTLFKTRERILAVVIVFGVSLLGIFIWMNLIPKTRVQLHLIHLLDGKEHSLNAGLADHVTIDGTLWTSQQEWREDVPLEVCIDHPDWERSCQWITLSQLGYDEDVSTPQLHGQERSTAKKITLALKARTALSELFSPLPKARSITQSDTARQHTRRTSRDSTLSPPLSIGETRSPSPKKDPLRSREPKSISGDSTSKPYKKVKKTQVHKSPTRQVKLSTNLEQVSLTCTLIDEFKSRARASRSEKVMTYQLQAGTPLLISPNTRCRAQAPHHASQTFVVPSQTNYQVTLKPTGTLSVRAHPPASRIWLDGQAVDNPSHRVTIQGRAHKLLVRYQNSEGTVVEKRQDLEIEPGGKLRVYLDMTQD